MSFKKILLAVDDSEYARKALHMVANLGECNRTPVVLVHVTAPIPALIGNPMRNKLKCQMEEMTEKTFACYKEMLQGKGMSVASVCAQGDPADEIIALAKSEACDIIVLGAKGHGNLAGLILGSVSQKVLHYSELPVLIAR